LGVLGLLSVRGDRESQKGGESNGGAGEGWFEQHGGGFEIEILSQERRMMQQLTHYATPFCD